MFDSVRVRLTLWYTGVLVLVLLPLSVGAYWLIVRTVERRTFISLSEISQGFFTTLQSEYKSQPKERAGPDALQAAAMEAAIAFRLRDHRFAVLDSSGNVLAENQALPRDAGAGRSRFAAGNPRRSSAPTDRGHRRNAAPIARPHAGRRNIFGRASCRTKWAAWRSAS